MSDGNTTQRKAGAPPGRRPVVWVCSGIKLTAGSLTPVMQHQLITEKFLVKDQDPGEGKPGSFPKELAEAEFYDKHGFQPSITLGPLFEKRGASAGKPKRKRLQIDRDNLDQYKFAVERRDAVFGDWKGYTNGIEGKPDLAFFLFIGEATPSGKKRNLPAPGIVNISDITFLDQKSEEAPQKSAVA